MRFTCALVYAYLTATVQAGTTCANAKLRCIIFVADRFDSVPSNVPSSNVTFHIDTLQCFPSGKKKGVCLNAQSWKCASCDATQMSLEG